MNSLWRYKQMLQYQSREMQSQNPLALKRIWFKVFQQQSNSSLLKNLHKVYLNQKNKNLTRNKSSRLKSSICQNLVSTHRYVEENLFHKKCLTLSNLQNYKQKHSLKTLQNQIWTKMNLSKMPTLKFRLLGIGSKRFWVVSTWIIQWRAGIKEKM